MQEAACEVGLFEPTLRLLGSLLCQLLGTGGCLITVFVHVCVFVQYSSLERL
jgi:hypothetical protein